MNREFYKNKIKCIDNKLGTIAANTQETKANFPSHQELTNPSSVIMSGWKKLDFVCSGAITVTIGSAAIIYPKTLGSTTVLGESLVADDKSENPVTFNGTGTVLITIQQ
jgi:hypothetical protein